MSQTAPVLGITSDSIVDVAPPDSASTPAGRHCCPGSGPASGMQGALAVDFALDLDPAEITDEVREYGAVSFLPERPLVEALRDLTTRIYNDFTYRSGSTTFPPESMRFCRRAKGYAKTLRGWRSPACEPTGWRPATCPGFWPPTHRRERIG
ncbi:putative transglutaminase/cysteine proteinase [Mycobacterium ulcerans str. Harvey]|uniref:Transglutaminase/cysteine proteinase n=1 Tax=Mycobacterium ulcerans str. Harvey TaxID=1299332 RepID=A0ABN0R8V4_MYCUL|nr:putative transglutaminase/cysteine proteinase [Mycobacterium ulcerans str. Harvey]